MVVRNPDQTRQMLLETAFHEMHRSGFQAASLDAILSASGVTKGALYHHFGSKKKLGIAVIDEVIRGWIHETWIGPLATHPNAVDALHVCLKTMRSEATEEKVRLGCPLNNLAQEMSPVDETFRSHIEAIFAEWRAAIADALRRSQSSGQVRDDIDVEATAAFVVAAFEGAIGTVKSAQSLPLARQILRGLEGYLESLRPLPHPAL